MRRAIDLVQHLDPAGVGARDLRECLLLQIAAQQNEFEELYGKRLPDPPEESPHRSFRDEADLKIEERRRAMEVGAMICDHHLHLLLKRDVKDLARAAQVTPKKRTWASSSSAPSIRALAACITARRLGSLSPMSFSSSAAANGWSA